MSNGAAGSASSYSLRVTAADVASAATNPDARALEWVRVAARAFPLLGTVSKAKRARKSGELTLNGSALVPTNVAAAVGDEIVYASRAAVSSAMYATGDQSSRIEEKEDRRGSGQCEDEEVDRDGEKDEDDAEIRRWAAVCERQGLRRVFENNEMALVVKPVGVHVKGRGKRTVERALLALLNPPQQRPASCNADGGDAALPTPHAVHRLDARVGGLLLVAKTRRAEVSLSAQFERHAVVKRYRAILAGRADDLTSHPSVSPLGCSSSKTDAESKRPVIPRELGELERDQQEQEILVRDEIDGKPCVTALRVVSLTRSARYDWISTVDLWPLTGRRHQLRVHMARVGLPIVGDDLYHESAGPALPPVVRGLGLFLFAVGIAFDDNAGDRSSTCSCVGAEDDDGGGNRRRFEIDEPPKFARFRHFCELNWRKKQHKLETERDTALSTLSDGDDDRQQVAERLVSEH